METLDKDRLSIREEPTVADIVQAIWRYRALTAVFVVLGFLMAIVNQHIATPVYTAQVVVAPIPKNMSLEQTGSALEGFSLLSEGSEAPQHFDLFLQLLTSFQIAQELGEQTELKQSVFANSWDVENEQWVQPKEFVVKPIFRVLFNKPWRPVSDQDFAAYLSNKVKRRKSGSFMYLTIDHKNPQLAYELLSSLVDQADKAVRKEELKVAQSIIGALSDRLATVQVASHRQVLIEILVDWEQRRLLADNSINYAAKVVEPVTVSSRPTSPNLKSSLVFFLGGGALLGLAMSLLLSLFGKETLRHLMDRFLPQTIKTKVKI